MTFIKTNFVLIFCLFLSACASTITPPSLDNHALVWHDKEFSYDEKLVQINQENLFKLAPFAEKKIKEFNRKQNSQQAKTDFLLATLYGLENTAFSYNKTGSTIAQETWDNQKGDCISLTILAYAMGKQLDLPIAMQEIVLPMQFERRSSLDFISLHVNAIISNRHLKLNNGSDRGYIIIDFEPQINSMMAGTPLRENEILARFYNNLAANFFKNGDHAAAYSHYKAAIIADPSFSDSYMNLAQLYIKENLISSAESMLKHSISINHENFLAYRTLDRVLREQNKISEAEKFVSILEIKQKETPYYWINKGENSLQKGEFTKAISELKTAQKFAIDFPEIQILLAKAYFLSHQESEAFSQISSLETKSPDHPKIQILRDLFNKSMPY